MSEQSEYKIRNQESLENGYGIYRLQVEYIKEKRGILFYETLLKMLIQSQKVKNSN